MSKTEWGAKRRCAKCEAPFYDMLRYPILCPKCGATFRPDAPTSRRSAAKHAPKARAPRVPPKSAVPTVDSGPAETEPRSYRASDVVDDVDQVEDDLELDDDDDDDDTLEADDDAGGDTAADEAGIVPREH